MTEHEAKYSDFIQQSTVREIFEFAGFVPVADSELVWNSRAGWLMRSWNGPDCVFTGSKQPGVQRVVTRGWTVPQCSIPLDFDEPMASMAGAYGCWDSLPQEVRDGALRYFEQFRSFNH